MNLNLLVEGKRTESIVYPVWLSHLVPRLIRIKTPDQAVHNHYCLFSGDGYPQLLHHLSNAVAEVNKYGNFDYLVLCLDVGELSPNEKEQQILKYLQDQQEELISTELVIICQNKCFETWFLGNREIFKLIPSNQQPNKTQQQLHNCLEFYNMRETDPPEKMSKPDGFASNNVTVSFSVFQVDLRGNKEPLHKKTSGVGHREVLFG